MQSMMMRFDHVYQSNRRIASARQNQCGFQRGRTTAAEIVPDDNPFQTMLSRSLSASERR